MKKHAVHLKKAIAALLFLALLSGLTLPVSASDYGSETILYEVQNGETALTGLSVDRRFFQQGFVIPASLGGAPVTKIADGAFSDFWGMNQLKLPDGIVSIGQGSFSYTGMPSVRFPSSLTSLGESAFSASGLTEVYFSPNGTSLELGAGVFSSTALTEITLPDYVKDLPPTLFSSCAELQSVTLPSSIHKIGAEAFEDCTALKQINLESIEEIDSMAFLRTGLTSLEFSDQLKNIEDLAFSTSTQLTSAHFGNSLKNIGVSAFEYSTLTEIDLPETVKTIGQEAFIECPNLTSVTIRSFRAKIGERAFGCCYDDENQDERKHAGKITIRGYKGSTAETYALENNLAFEVLPGSPPAQPDFDKLEKPQNLAWSTKQEGLISFDPVESCEGGYLLTIYVDGEKNFMAEIFAGEADLQDGRVVYDAKQYAAVLFRKDT